MPSSDQSIPMQQSSTESRTTTVDGPSNDLVFGNAGQDTHIPDSVRVPDEYHDNNPPPSDPSSEDKSDYIVYSTLTHGADLILRSDNSFVLNEPKLVVVGNPSRTVRSHDVKGAEEFDGFFKEKINNPEEQNTVLQNIRNQISNHTNDPLNQFLDPAKDIPGLKPHYSQARTSLNSLTYKEGESILNSKVKSLLVDHVKTYRRTMESVVKDWAYDLFKKSDSSSHAAGSTQLRIAHVHTKAEYLERTGLNDGLDVLDQELNMEEYQSSLDQKWGDLKWREVWRARSQDGKTSIGGAGEGKS
ncbi:uncharacterized protein I206_101390 [Kwoniella pini CBS 10737]|uniref:Uncharacterized protein n=1 Tax=Kwoniella pini CBS 10737 TaxID=1296096 RepID=A0A1B9HWT5_9TREE|nr:uncharacterized protein I206_06640 [Kwoniella pini CBS 10737]OCF47734.1 hypothetical protein I206_06640 [Kwoniella pini CBS 10737]